MSSATGPKIRRQEDELPLAPMPHRWRGKVIAESARWGYSQATGRPYVSILCRVIEGEYIGRKLFYAYTMHVKPGFPKTKEECENFQPREIFVEVDAREFNGNIYNNVRRVLNNEQA